MTTRRTTSEPTSSMAALPPEHALQRVVIEGVRPQVDGGRFPAKASIGRAVIVHADILADGHDELSARLLYRHDEDGVWSEADMLRGVNDGWQGQFVPSRLGQFVYTIEAWIDHFRSWQRDLIKRVEAHQDVAIEILVGAELLGDAEGRTTGSVKQQLSQWKEVLEGSGPLDQKLRVAQSADVASAVAVCANRETATRFDRELRVVADPELARFSTWYEMFPRSCAETPGSHGTFQDCERRLPYVASMGFDVLYLPPIHPIGRTHRKGKNNSKEAREDDLGSPWAIGSSEGGHKSIEPRLGSLEDFRALVSRAQEHGIKIALDLAFQCSPDHPYVREHPDWFTHRPDGSVRFAENPPKQYEDIYPLNFECADWRSLWAELLDVVEFWRKQGVHVFRVDNPHTKPFRFWEWLIGQVKQRAPDAIFLAEAFTRPKVMYDLAKLGFAQSYTYFAWRNMRWEIEQYFTELTRTDVAEFFRPNLWPNTPDILTDYLQTGGHPAFVTRLVLAATLSANYGIYGPAFELCEREAIAPVSEEYLNSEKYEIRHWDIDSPQSLRDIVARVNRIRRDNEALQDDGSLAFHRVDNEQMICYSKCSADDTIVVVANLDPHHTQSGWVDLDGQAIGVDMAHPYQAHDLLGDGRYLWQGTHNYVELNPHVLPAHIFRIRHRTRTEHDFDYFM